MKIIIFSATSTTFDLNNPDQPLGGADTALLQLIEDLSTEHEVTAFIPIVASQQGSFKGAECLPYANMFNQSYECDIFIHNRRLWAIPNNVKYKKAVFYSQDTINTPCFSGIKDKTRALDVYSRIWVLSNFHKQNMQEMFDVFDDKFLILGNYADPQEKVKKKELQFIYASTPYRGLDVLLKLWTKIIEKYPTATLHVFSSMEIYGAKELDDLHFGKMFNDLRTGRFKGVIFHGTTTRKEMLEVMKTSKLLLYPNTYPETYCNVLMEARACHTPFITSNLGSLKETGGFAGNYCIKKPRTEEYLQEFLSLLEYSLKNPLIYKVTQINCYPIRTKEDYKKDLLNEIKRLNKEINEDEQ